MFVMIDGMDTTKTSLPHHRRESKLLVDAAQLKVHALGVMAFGQPEPVQVYLNNESFAGDGNMTVTVLHNALMRNAEEMNIRNENVTLDQIARGLDRKWPSVLYLQVDNSPRDNKNMTFFGYCALLVKVGMFAKVKVNFGLVGHTHDIIDQLFSRLST